MSNSARPDFPGRPPGGPHAHLFQERPELADASGTIQRILERLAGARWTLALVFLCATATTLISIAGTRLSGYAVDAFIRTGDARGLGIVCLVMAGLYVVHALSTYQQNAMMIAAAQRTSADLRKDLFANIQRLPLHYFDTHASGDLMSRLTNDVDNIATMLSQGLVPLFSGIVNIVGMLVAMLFLSPLLTLVALAMMPLMFLGTRIIARKTLPSFVAQQRELGRLNGFIEENVSGQKAISLFSHERQVLAGFSEINDAFVQSSVKAQGLSGIMGPLNNTINNLTYLVISVCGGFLVLRGGGMTVGIVFSFLLYMRGFTRPVNEILNLFNALQSALASGERIFEVIDAEKERDRASAQDIHGIAGSVRFEEVGFSYVPGKPVLQEADLQAEPGQTIAIVGPTGAGKTTIINLLTKFYLPDRGRILIDGQDIRDITTGSLRTQVSVVLQEPFLFSASVRENLRYGRLAASDEEVEDAARCVMADGFIRQLPHGYETVLADNGGDLSQGQRQLLSIARAALSGASVLVLDEATSSIDTRTEMLIQKGLMELMKGKTSFVIAHRLSTIRNADRIIVIKGGRVVETGTHDGLVRENGYYADLYNSQFKSGLGL